MQQNDTDPAKVWGLSYHGWAVFFIGAWCCAAALYQSGVVQGSARLWIMFVPLVLVPPMSIAQARMLGKRGYSSPALARYNRRLAIAIPCYMAALLSAVHIFDQYQPGPAATSGLAVIAILPAVAMIVAMARYLQEETDEYLRHRATSAALVGLGLVLILGTVWGFFESFGLLPGLSAWWVLPVWAIGLGAGNFWLARRAQ